MYHKIKNTLAGLGMVAAFIAGGALFADPIPTAPAPASHSLDAEARETEFALLVVRTALTLAERELAATARGAAADGGASAADESRANRSARLKRELGMPYYSFGALLPRRGES